MPSPPPLWPGHHVGFQRAHHSIQRQTHQSTNDQGRESNEPQRQSNVTETRQLDEPRQLALIVRRQPVAVEPIQAPAVEDQDNAQRHPVSRQYHQIQRVGPLDPMQVQKPLEAVHIGENAGQLNIVAYRGKMRNDAKRRCCSIM